MSSTAAAHLRIELLRPEHDRGGFSCGVESLDHYLKTQASQDIRRKANAVFILAEQAAPRTILGYATLCATALEFGDVPDAARKLIPRYPLVSATLLGRLAIAGDRLGQGLGGILLALVLLKAYQSADSVGSTMVVVDAIDEPAAAFYVAHGFTRLAGGQRLVMGMRGIEALVREKGMEPK